MNVSDSASADSRHPLRRVVFGTWFLKLSHVLMVSLLASTALFGTVASAAETVIVRNDPGGAVDARMRLVRSYQRGGTRVEIRKGFCLSACTMYLALPKACVTPDAVLGFHGPSSRIYGISLPPESFEHWSRVMAAHYPEPIKTWFLKKGRFRTVGFYMYSGQQLIDMGIRQCTV